MEPPAPNWIGGEWTLADLAGVPPLSWSVERFLGRHLRPDGHALVNSGRVALRRAIEALGGTGGHVLLPAYGCPALTQAVRDAGAVAAYYPGDAGRQPDWQVLGRLAQHFSAPLLVVVHAFGVLQNGDAVRRVAQASGATVVEDCSHTLGNAPGHRFLGPGTSDAVIASLRKVLPVGCGGLWALWNGSATPEQGPAGRDAFAEARQRHLALPPSAARHRGLQHAEQLLDADARPGPLPDPAAHALRVLAAAAPELAEAWRRRCRENWSAFHQGLAGTAARPLMEDGEAGVCPPGFPILHPNRHLLARRLLEQGIEAALHWPIVPEARPWLTRQERLLAGTILTLPCDGRMAAADVDRVVAAVASGDGQPEG